MLQGGGAAIPKKARWKEVADTFDNIWNVLVWSIATTAGDVEHMYIDTLCASWTSVYPFTALRHDMLMLYQPSGTTVPGFCMGCSMAQAFCRRSFVPCVKESGLSSSCSLFRSPILASPLLLHTSQAALPRTTLLATYMSSQLPSLEGGHLDLEWRHRMFCERVKHYCIVEMFIELALLVVRMRPSCLEITPSDSDHVERKLHFGEHKKATHASTL